jgi:hypothetical protein
MTVKSFEDSRNSYAIEEVHTSQVFGQSEDRLELSDQPDF